MVLILAFPLSVLCIWSQYEPSLRSNFLHSVESRVRMSLKLKAEDFEQPFDPTNFVERISANVVGGGTKGGEEGFDPLKLRDHFLDTIKNLQKLQRTNKWKMVGLKLVCRKQEQKHKEKAIKVEKQYKDAATKFNDLDDRINSVATKVVHLGDQLENISIPRQRVLETEQVMRYFDQFHSGKRLSPIFTDPQKLHEGAPIICQLLMVADELPKEKFERVQRKILEKYSVIESDLQKELLTAYEQGEVKKMHASAKTLLPFKNYNECYDKLIKRCVHDWFPSEDVFKDIVLACGRMQDLASKVFESNTEHVVIKFVSHIFDKKLQGYIHKQFRNKDEMDAQKYLELLAVLYKKTKDANKELSEIGITSDSTFLDRISKPIFSKYLNTYIDEEKKHLEENAAAELNRFYNDVGHIKREIRQMPETLRELQRMMPGREKNILKDIVLSQNVAVQMLEDNRGAIQRCQLLSPPSDLPDNVYKMFQIFLRHFGDDHFEYAIDVGLQHLPPLEPKSPPDLLFLNLLRESNTIFHWIEKHVTEYVFPNIGSSAIYNECTQRKKTLIDSLENKLNQGLERVLASMINYLKFLLHSEQQKSDFRPESDAMGATTHTTACVTVCHYLKEIVPEIRNALDGKNRDVVFTEIGTQFHKLLLDHLYQYTYTDIGAMVALCDVNEYRHCMKLFKVPLIERLFGVMLELVNLLVVLPENLSEVGADLQKVGIEPTVLQQFVQMRADFKTLKLGKVF